MLAPELVPQEPERLARLFVQLPALPQDTPASCPVSVGELAVLAADDLGVPVGVEDVSFVRTADFDELRYWVWRLGTAVDGLGAWLVVSASPEGEGTFGCIVDRWGLTAEQAVVGDHFGVV